MKRIVSFVLAGLCAAGLCSCNTAKPASSVTSSDSLDRYASWLGEKVGNKAEVYIGDAADAGRHGIDMTGFLPDGYVIRTEGDEVLIFGADENGVDLAVHDYAKHIGEAYAKTYNEGYRVKRITLAGYDISEYALVLEADADANTVFAAENIRDYTERACGVRLPIVNTHQAREIVFVPDPDGSLGDEGFTIRTSDGRLEIVCGRYRGALWGALEFIEQYEGWRFIMAPAGPKPGEDAVEYLYESDGVVIPVGIEDTQTPDFAERIYQGGGWQTQNIDKAYRLKFSFNGAPEKYAGYGVYDVACHGLHTTNLFRDFETLTPNRQFCFTDPDVLDAIVERYTGYVQAQVDAGKIIGYDLMEVDAAQIDSPGFCDCRNCKKLYNAHGGVKSAGVINMANILAPALNEKFPGIYVDVFAYWGTLAPPAKMEVDEHIKVSYCWYLDDDGMGMPCNTHCVSGKDCESTSRGKKHFGQYFEKWCELTTMVDMWYYSETYYPCVPDGNVMILLDNLKYMKEQGCVGGVSLAGSTPFYGLMQTVMARLMWDCDLTVEEYRDIIREYFFIVYGEGSGDEMYAYFTMVENAARQVECSNVLKSNPKSKLSAPYFDAHYEEMIALIDDAVENADSFRTEDLIRYISMSMDFMGIISRWETWHDNGTAEQKAFIGERYHVMYDNSMKYGFNLHNYPSMSFPSDGMDFETSPLDYTDEKKVK